MKSWIFWCMCLGVSVTRAENFDQTPSFPASRGPLPEPCAGIYSCLIRNLNEKLDQVQSANSYRFTKDLWLGKVRDLPAKAGKAKDASVGYRKTFGSVVKRAMDLFKSHSLFWNFAPGLDLKVTSAESGKFDATVQPSAIDTRTFGGFGMRRRIAFALLPIMYKMGVITTLLVGLTVFTLKGLTIGIILLFFTLTSTFHKLKYGFGHGFGAQVAVPEKNVHIHIHNGGLDHGHGQYVDHSHGQYVDHSQYVHPVHTGSASWERSPLPHVSGSDVHYHHFTVDDAYTTTTGPYSYYYNK